MDKRVGVVLADLPGRIEMFGAPIDPWTMEQTVGAIDTLIKRKEFAHVIGINADKVLQMRDDQDMASIVNQCEVVNADGASMLIAAKKLGMYLPERVAGIDLMEALCQLSERNGYRIYLLGAKDYVVSRTAAVLNDRYPLLRIAGYRDGYFGEDDYSNVIDDVLNAAPDIVFVGITSPKKEQLIERFREVGARGVFLGVGGSFDVISGAIPRAPMWMQKANLEWLFRMMQEPGRLIRRYIVGNVRFLLLLQFESMRRRRK